MIVKAGALVNPKSRVVISESPEAGSPFENGEYMEEPDDEDELANYSLTLG